ncbi:hypothetical protein ACFX13_014041 [Malus domestica]
MSRLARSLADSLRLDEDGDVENNVVPNKSSTPTLTNNNSALSASATSTTFQFVGKILVTYMTRIRQLIIHDVIRYVQVFKNHGASAGASISHSHSQIMALPIVPTAVDAQLDSMKEYFDQTGNCSVCEFKSSKDLLVDVSAHFVSIVPFAATFPFEI